VLIQRRKQEAARQAMANSVKEDFLVGASAEWEMRTDAKLKQRAVQARYDSIRAQDKAALIERRRRVAQMLMAEEAEFQRQVDALDEGPAERRVRMETRARELRDKREAERKAYVEEQLERQWRLGCDELRNADSVNIAKACDQARGYQIEERLQLLALQQQQEKIFAEQWLTDAAAKEKRELEEEAFRKQMDIEQLRILDRQVGEKRAVLDAESAEREQEAEALARQWVVEKEAQEEAEFERRRKQYAAKLELDDFNIAKKSERSRAYAQELEQDRARLSTVLAKEAEDERIEQEHYETLKKESLAYQRHLQLLMEKEAADEAELEKARDADLGTSTHASTTTPTGRARTRAPPPPPAEHACASTTTTTGNTTTTTTSSSSSPSRGSVR
jgi:hypothetical protein